MFFFKLLIIPFTNTFWGEKMYVKVSGFCWHFSGPEMSSAPSMNKAAQLLKYINYIYWCLFVTILQWERSSWTERVWAQTPSLLSQCNCIGHCCTDAYFVWCLYIFCLIKCVDFINIYIYIWAGPVLEIFFFFFLELHCHLKLFQIYIMCSLLFVGENSRYII